MKIIVDGLRGLFGNPFHGDQIRDEAETAGRKCVCNALMASIDLGQIQKDGEPELPLVTSGDDVANVARFLKPGADTYTAADVIDYLLRDVAPA